MKNAVKKAVSMLLCAAILATSFSGLGVVASAAEGYSQIASYEELDACYDNFVYVGMEVYETNEFGYLELTDHYVNPGDWLEFRTYIKSDLYVGNSQIYSLFDNSFFDVSSPSEYQPSATDYTTNVLTVTNPDFPTDYTITPEAYVTSRAASDVPLIVNYSGLSEDYLATQDTVYVSTQKVTAEDRRANLMAYDTWLYSYKVQVKEDVTDGAVGIVDSPDQLWEAVPDESTGNYMLQKPNNISISEESIYSGVETVVTGCVFMANYIKGGNELNFINEDMEHTFVVGENPEDNNQNKRYLIDFFANGGWFSSHYTDYYCAEFYPGEMIMCPEYPVKEGYTFMGWSRDPFASYPDYEITAMPEENIQLYAVWEANAYTATWMVDGAEYLRSVYLVDTMITPPDAPTKAGYVFAGWATEDNPDVIIDPNYMMMPCMDVTFIAVFEPCEATYTVNIYHMYSDGTYGTEPSETIQCAGLAGEIARYEPVADEGFYVDESISTLEGVIRGDSSLVLEVYYARNAYTLTLNPNGGIFGDSSEEICAEYLFGETIDVPRYPIKDGFLFAGWEDVGSGELFTHLPSEMPATDLCFVAVWEYADYIVEWYSEGELLEVHTYAYGANIQPPEYPTKVGYEFVGWTQEEGSDIIVDIERMTMPACDITFYAVYVPCEDTNYTVEFYHMNTEGEYELTSTENHTGVSDAHVEFSPTELEGFTVDTDRSVLSGPIFADGSLLLQVYYNRNKYVVTFEYEYETVSYEYYYGSMITEPEIPCKEGYDFDGWVDSYGNRVEFPYIMPAENIRFTATWRICEYNVYYNLDGGYFPGGEYERVETYYFGDEIHPEYPVREGYTFSGWIIEETGEEVIMPMQMPARDITLRAQWNVNVYEIRFVDGYGNDLAIYRADYGSEISNIVYDAPMPERYGYTFVGWVNDFTGEPFYEGMAMPAQELVFRAEWDVNHYTATWIVDGYADCQADICFGEIINFPAPPERMGYSFAGWEYNGNIYSDHSSLTMPAEDIIFTAVFIANSDTPYTVEVYEMDTEGTYPTEPTYTQVFIAETESVVTAPVELYTKDGFSVEEYNSILTALVQPDGSTVLEVYLARNVYELSIDTEDNIETVSYYYGSIVTEPVTPCKDGYYFDGWLDKNGVYVRFPFTMPAENISICARWIAAEHTITFDADGGYFYDGSSQICNTYLYGESITPLVEPTREGYTFEGWMDENGCIVDVPEYMPACDVYLVALWMANEYTILWYDGETVIEDVFGYGDFVTAPPNPYKEGYTFCGWYNEETGDSYIPETMPAQNLTYIAQWTINTYEVRWFNEGEIWAVENYEYGWKIIPPPDPAREGYIFMGWLDDYGNFAEFPYVVTEDMLFTALWEPIECTLTFDANGAEFSDGRTEITETLYYGSATVVPDYPCREGYYFMGWSTDPNLPYLVNVPEIMPAYNLTLFAVWEIAEYTVSFDDGDGNIFLTMNADYGEDLGIIEYISCPEKDGYIFSHWEIAETGEAFTFPATMPAYDITLVAVWDYGYYTVTWNTDGMQTVEEYQYGTEIMMPPEPYKEGYEFVGWTPEVPPEMPAQDLYFHAVWEPNAYTIHFEYDGGYNDYGEPYYAVTYLYGEAIYEPEIPVREGCIFVGWRDESGYIVDVPSTMPSYDITLIAVWEYELYTVTWDIDGMQTVYEYRYGDYIEMPPDPCREGFTFAGWESWEYGYDYLPDIMPAQDLYFRAMWVPNQYVVRWNIDGIITEEYYDYGQEIVTPVSPEKEGYLFAGWSPEVPDYMPACELEFTAEWEVAGPAVYTVETYKMNTTGEYEKDIAVYNLNTYGEISVAPVVPEGFELNGEKSVLSCYADVQSEPVLKVYLDRIPYKFTKIINGNSYTTEYLYGSIIAEPLAPSKDGYIFIGWEGEIPRTMPANDVTITAKFREVTPEDNVEHEISLYITPLKNVTLNYGESIKLQAYPQNLPAGYEIKWSVDSSCVRISTSANGRICTVTSTSSGGAAITAWIVDENGQKVTDKNGDVIKDTEILYSEVNTWLMIINFFKKLFGIDV